jgi:hypothetical protein
MGPVLPARDISLEDLQASFGLQFRSDPQFFPEWQEDLPEVTETEKNQLDRLKHNYFNLMSRRPALEEVVKMVVLSPLLDLAGFYQAPFSIQTEVAVAVTAEDEGITVRGNIDVLVVQKRLWILVIESKSSTIDVMAALPQALAYMLASPHLEKPSFGFLLNGREFVFVKLQRNGIPQYSRSYALSLERENELEQVLGVLKQIGQTCLQSPAEDLHNLF